MPSASVSMSDHDENTTLYRRPEERLWILLGIWWFEPGGMTHRPINRPHGGRSRRESARSRPTRPATPDQWFALGPTAGRGSGRTDMPFADLCGPPRRPANPRVGPPARAPDPVAGASIEPDEPVGDTRDRDRVVGHCRPPARPLPHRQAVTDPAHAGHDTSDHHPDGGSSKGPS